MRDIIFINYLHGTGRVTAGRLEVKRSFVRVTASEHNRIFINLI